MAMNEDYMDKASKILRVRQARQERASKILRVRQARQERDARKLNTIVYNLQERRIRSDEAQLAKLDYYLGKGQGAKKERARLLARIENRKAK
jgi:hypothetical protein